MVINAEIEFNSWNEPISLLCSFSKRIIIGNLGKSFNIRYFILKIPIGNIKRARIRGVSFNAYIENLKRRINNLEPPERLKSL